MDYGRLQITVSNGFADSVSAIRNTVVLFGKLLYFKIDKTINHDSRHCHSNSLEKQVSDWLILPTAFLNIKFIPQLVLLR